MNLITESKNCRPPRNATTDPEDAVLSFITGAAAASCDLWAAYTSHDGVVGPPKGKVWLELEAVGSDCYVRFTRTALTATTNATGALVKVGTPRTFYIDPNTRDKFIDSLATGAGLLKYRVVSQIGERARV